MNTSPLRLPVLNRTGYYLKTCRREYKLKRDDALDQCPATVDTVVRRLSLLWELFDLKNQNILLLGDDDLFSVAMAAAGVTGNLTVLDCDFRILDAIVKCTPSGSVKVIQHDVRNELPSSLRCCFDLVFTDPPYTVAGQHLFLKRAAEALRHRRGSSICTCASRVYVRPSDLKTLLTCADWAGLKLVRLYEDFNFYKSPPDVKKDLRNKPEKPNPSFLTSTLFHLHLTQDCCDSSEIPTLGSDIYTYEDTDAQS